MSAIHLLDNSITDLIAAGEVVERPASVVKELVENAIDAGATDIKVEIFGGGIKKIQISDNGSGMSAEDAPKAFLKHATSKISNKDDLYSINTLGFRGEALCAISAVSKVTLKTKRKEDVFATGLYLEGGKILSQDETAYGDGTSITVENLFFNTPARFKFLKAEPAEAGAITSLMECLALSHPEISFRYFINGAEKFFTAGRGNLSETVYGVCGKEFCDAMLSAEGKVPYKSGEISVSGFCGKPLFSKANRNKQYFFINGRYVKSRVLQNALENAYRSYIMVGRFPVSVLFLKLDPKDVDINVHPSKLEVKFSDEKTIYDLVTSAVSSAVKADRSEQQFRFFKTDESRAEEKTPVSNPVSERKETIDRLINENLVKKTEPIVYSDWVMTPAVGDSSEKAEEKTAEVADIVSEGKVGFKNFDVEISVRDKEQKPVSAPTENYEKPSDLGENCAVEEAENPVILPATEEHFSAEIKENSDGEMKVTESVGLLSENTEKEIDEPLQQTLVSDGGAFKVIGECFKTYVIIEKEDEISFIDKHALHERMNFEKLKSQKRMASQQLLTPIIFTTSSDNYAYICANTEKLEEYGFEAEDFGDNTIIVRAIPEMLEATDAEIFLEKFASVKTDSKTAADAELFDVFLYDIACKASIKAGKLSTKEELEALISEYLKNKNNLKYCPHGRPIEFSVSKKEMEKQFKRIV